jgi:hypothetical protein
MPLYNPKSIRDIEIELRNRRSVQSKELRSAIDRDPKIKQYFKLRKDYKNELKSLYKTASKGVPKEERATSRKTISLPGGDIQLQSLDKFMKGKANFRQIKNIMNKLLPELQESYQYGHANLSVLRGLISLALNEDKKEPFLSKEERKRILALYKIAEEIDAIIEIPEGFNKSTLIQQLKNTVEAGPDIKVDWEKDVDILKGINGRIRIEAEFTDLNLSKGNLSAWVGEMFAQIIRQESKTYLKYLEKVNIDNLSGSPTLVEDVESAILSVFSKVKGKKNFSGNRPKRTRSTTRSKPKKVSKKVKVEKLPSIKYRQPSKGVSSTPLQLIGLINKQLPQVVAKNMESPALNFQTGRFASGVRITDIVTTPQGFPSIGYTYDKYPYQTFEPGFEQGDPDRDPRKLINRSIREIAAQYAIGRFYTRRV